mgnify:CR=1 FL=1
MLEIFFIWKLVVYVGKSVNKKGLPKTRYQIMAGIIFIIGELSGSFLGFTLFKNYPYEWPIYIIAIVFALLGAWFALLIVKLLPHENNESKTKEDYPNENLTSLNTFSRSIWIPTIGIVVSIFCLLFFIGVSVVFNLNEIGFQVEASNPIIGIDIDDDGKISSRVFEIPKETEVIYFGFDFELTIDSQLPIDFIWYIDGYKVYAFKEPINEGNIVVSLNRMELGIPEFNKGLYEVTANSGDKLLTSAQFVIK